MQTSPDESTIFNVGDILLVSHRDGYSMGSIVEKLVDDVYRVSLWPTKQVLEVSLDDMSKVRWRAISLNVTYIWFDTTC